MKTIGHSIVHVPLMRTGQFLKHEAAGPRQPGRGRRTMLALLFTGGLLECAPADDVITEVPLGYVRATYRTRVVTPQNFGGNTGLVGETSTATASSAVLNVTYRQGAQNPNPPAGDGNYIDPATESQGTVTATWEFPVALEGIIYEKLNNGNPTGVRRLEDRLNRAATIMGGQTTTLTRMPGYTGDMDRPAARLWLNRHLKDLIGVNPNNLNPSNQTNPPLIGQGSGGTSTINFGVSVPASQYVRLNPAEADRLVIELRASSGVASNGPYTGQEIVVEGIYDVEIVPLIRLRSWTGDVEVVRHGGPTLDTSMLEADMLIHPRDAIFTGLDSTAVLESYDERYIFGKPENGNPRLFQVTIEELTDVTVENVARPWNEDIVRTRLWLAAGRVSADINHSTADRSNFAVKTPTVICGVNGTIFSMGYFPAFGPHEEVSFVNLTQGGPVTIEPVNPGFHRLELGNPGDSVRVGSTSGVTGGYRQVTTPVIPGYSVVRYLNLSKPINEPDISAGGMAMNAAGQLIILDREGSRLMRVTPPSNLMTELAVLGGDGYTWVGPVMRPDGKAVVANRMTGEIVEVSSGGTVTTLAPAGPQRVTGLALRADGSLLAPAQTPGVIHAVSTGGVVTEFLSGLQDPCLPVVTGTGRVFYMDRTATDQLYEATGAPPAATALGTPFATDRALAFTELSSFGLVCAHGPLGAYGQTELLAVDPNTGARTEIGRRFSQPVAIVGDPNSVFYVCDSLAGAVFKATKIPPSTPVADVGAAKMGFGSVLVNSTTQRTVTLVNVGTADLQLLSAASTNPAYTVAAPAFPLTLTPGQETLLTLNFNPTAGGAFSSTINVQTNDPANPTLAIDLSGEVLVPTVTSVEPAGALPGEMVGARLINVGAVDSAIDLFVNGVEVAAVLDRSQGVVAFFQLPASLPPGQMANISVVENGLSAPAFAYQAAPAAGPLLVLDMSTTNGLNFGGALPGRSLDLPLPLLNRGNALLTVNDVQVPAGFQVMSPPRPFDIAAGGSASLVVRFAPPAGGFFQGNLLLFSNSAAGSPLAAFMFGRTVADAEGTWRTAKFGAQSGNALIAGPQADPDGDGILNLLERALGGNPLTGGEFKPVAPSAPAADGSVIMTVLVDTSAEDTVVALEYSASLAGSWTELARYFPQGGPPPMRIARNELRFVSQSAVGGGPVWQITERLLRGSAAAPGFFRMRVIGPQ